MAQTVHDGEALRVAVDARLNAYRVGGIPQYTSQLVTALGSIAPHDRYTLLEHRRATRPAAEGRNIKHRRLWTPPHNRWEQWALPLELWRLEVDLLHSPDFIPLFRRRVPAVITIHDLAYLHYPEILDDDAKRYYGQIHRAVQSADAIIAVSEATAGDIREMLKVPAERITVIAEAASPFYTPLPLEEGSTREINGVPITAKTFILFVGTIEPRKNLPTLLRALVEARASQASDMRLVLAGSRGWLDAPIFQLIEDLKLCDVVSTIGGVEQDDLRWLYNACRFYVQPELYSGFGLPVLEAMQCGAAVVVSNTSSLPELVDEAGLLLPPTDVERWAEALQRLWTGPELCAALGARARERAAHFTWERAARETRALYARVAGKTIQPAQDADQEPDEGKAQT